MTGLLLVQIAVILVAARLCGLLLARFGQPPVIGEMAAGVLLGPVVFGAALPELHAALFPAASLPGLSTLATLGLVLFMFVVGAELRAPEGARAQVLAAARVAGLSALLPFALAVAVAPLLHGMLAPMALSTLLILAALRGTGVELNLFHLVSLVLAAGLGLDYALFFDHAGDNRDEQLRTLHAVIVCSLTTLLVFSLLALSSIPVLRAIGATVALGVLFNFLLALLVARAPAAGRAA